MKELHHVAEIILDFKAETIYILPQARSQTYFFISRDFFMKLVPQEWKGQKDNQGISKDCCF